MAQFKGEIDKFSAPMIKFNRCCKLFCFGGANGITLRSKRISIYLSILSSFLLFACSTTVEVKKPLPFDCVKNITLSKGIEKGAIGMPVEPTTTFSTEDKEVIAYLKCSNLTGEHKLRWEWYDPNGKLYLSTGNYPLYTSSGKYVKEATAWHRLSISGEKAVNYSGDWQVKVYLDGDTIASKGFTIEVIDIDKPPKTAQMPNPKDWGLIIGIESYANLPSVDYAKRDAHTVKEYFKRVLGVPEENIISLLDSKATKSQIEGYLKSYIPKNVDNDTNLYVYFAGHGIPDIEKGDAYLVPYDGDTRFITQTGYKLRSFYEDLNNLNIKKSYVFLDACFSGTGARSNKILLAGARPALIHVEDIALLSDKVISLTASTGGQISNSYPEKEHGLFTYFLLSGLKGSADTNKDGWVSIAELYNYVKDNVSRVSRRKGIEQTPVVIPSFDAVKDIADLKISRAPK